MRPILTRDRESDELAPEPMLIIWVETRCLPGGRASVSRWQGTFNDAVELTAANNDKIASAVVPDGYRLGGQLRGQPSLKPGGPGVTDTLAFKVPPSAAGNLWLKLRANHVGESGWFFHLIPSDVWDQKRR
ncbi:hypothetical protein C1280_01210 [Gemmata obscuriglobus]|uniref:Uncharacterized protein n=1 Tax=Gemmata obscuriglobus TaxID=114 RepID=A0A2Z3GVV8_9BACT|nr:hypothetical protein C1280_01210 [Gemmata obscuriglobus]